MSQNRYIIDAQKAATPEESGSRALEELISLTEQLNQSFLPVVVGPQDSIPEGMLVGQPVIDWSSGTTTIKVWNGTTLV